jgi:hypothetical protein
MDWFYGNLFPVVPNIENRNQTLRYSLQESVAHRNRLDFGMAATK